MKSLLILRHAKSSRKDETLSDHDRPLNRRGKRDAPRLGRLVLEEGLVPDLIVSSTANRARTTAEEVAASCGYGGAIRMEPDLYHGGVADFLELLRALPAACASVMIVGHNPGLEMLLEVLTGVDDTLATATLAHVELAIDAWPALEPHDEVGALIAIWRPREL